MTIPNREVLPEVRDAICGALSNLYPFSIYYLLGLYNKLNSFDDVIMLLDMSSRIGCDPSSLVMSVELIKAGVNVKAAYEGLMYGATVKDLS